MASTPPTVADREEYAPADGKRRRVLDRLAADFAHSHAEPLAIDAAEREPERLEALSRDRALAEDAARSAGGGARSSEVADGGGRALVTGSSSLARTSAPRGPRWGRLQRREEAARYEAWPAGRPRSGPARCRERLVDRDFGIDR